MDILNSILACASEALDGLYPNYPVFTEFVPDELPDRCFLLGFAGDVDIRHALGSRFEVRGKLDITFIAPRRDDESNQENNSVFSAISLQLRHLSHNDIQLRLGSHQRRDVDGVLHDICSFHTFLYKINDTPYMEKINIYPSMNE